MEFALVLPIFLLLVMALFDFGRVVYAQHTITEDSREAARKGQVQPALFPVTPFYSLAQYLAIRNAALAQSPGVSLTGSNVFGETSTACVDKLVPDPVAGTCFYPDGTDVGARVVVNISIKVGLITPIMSQILGGDITVTAQSTAYIQ